jgi:hypothetical protein
MYYLVEKKSIGRWWSYGSRKESVDKAFVYTLEVGFLDLLLRTNFRQLAAV